MNGMSLAVGFEGAATASFAVVSAASQAHFFDERGAFGTGGCAFWGGRF